jgi:hypothetical protein
VGIDTGSFESRTWQIRKTLPLIVRTTPGRQMKLRLIIISLTFLFACSPTTTKESEFVVPSDYKITSNYFQDTIGQFVYNIKDTTSTIFISYHECTECLDAWVDSGQLFIDQKTREQIVDVVKKRGIGFAPNGHDLFLTGQGKIAEILFGDSSNFEEHWHDKFMIKGKAIGIKSYGIVFKVDTYKKL